MLLRVFTSCEVRMVAHIAVSAVCNSLFVAFISEKYEGSFKQGFCFIDNRFLNKLDSFALIGAHF